MYVCMHAHSLTLCNDFSIAIQELVFLQPAVEPAPLFVRVELADANGYLVQDLYVHAGKRDQDVQEDEEAVYQDGDLDVNIHGVLEEGVTHGRYEGGSNGGKRQKRSD